jgi:hypothetical protein
MAMGVEMLDPEFDFSQGSLQDYEDCQRRFQLRYVERQAWPAVEAEPFLEREEHGEQGRRFHRLMERYFSGVPVELIEAGIRDDLLRRWWRAFLEEPPLNLPDELRLPEVRFSVPVADRRIVAVFDLLAIDPGRRLVVVDWKTGRWRPERDVMQSHLQTRVYPFVAVEAAARYFGGPIDPARVTMVYWFAEGPAQPHVFHYDQAMHDAMRQYLERQIELISTRPSEGVWPLVEDVSVCRFCAYRSLCDRGVVAGDESVLVGEDLDLGVAVGEVGWLDVDEVVY